MPSESVSSDISYSIKFRLAWLGAILVLLYLATLSHWSSPDGFMQIAHLSGWSWRSELLGPATFLITYPLRWLPTAWIPFSASLFTACCAALALVLLFRSVMLLPHSSTYEERLRTSQTAGLLTIPSAWVPPVLAVLTCGLQLSFWENSTTPTGEIFDLLLFACLIWCFMEFRASQNDSWLYRWGVIYGVAVANNWAMAAFFPAFLIAFAWVKGFNVFNIHFLERISEEGFQILQPRVLGRMMTCCLAGFSLILLMPLLAVLTSSAEFWPSLKYTFQYYKAMVTSIPVYVILLSCLIPGLSILAIGSRWSQSLGSPSPFVLFLTDAMFNLFCWVLLIGCLGTALDLPFSPRNLSKGAQAFLPLYYVGALGLGYLSGYFLLIVTPSPVETSDPHPLTPHVNRLFAAGVWISLAIVPALLCYRNLPYILQKKNGPMVSYASRLVKEMPPSGAMIFSEDSMRLHCLRAALSRSGQSTNYLLVNASALAADPAYFNYLDKKNPELKLSNLVTNQSSTVTNLSVLQGLVEKLSKTRELYFLHPSLSIFCEPFWMEPHGLFYKLVPLDSKPQRLPSQVVDENQAFWKTVANEELTNIMQMVAVPPKSRAGSRLIKALCKQPEKQRWAQIVGECYSGGVNTWGVTLQKYGMTKEAGRYFELATQFNPKNVAADVNRKYNLDLQEQREVPVMSLRDISDKYGAIKTWHNTVKDGPFDEPSFCCHLGNSLAKARLYRQGIEQLERSKALAPADLTSSAFLSRTLLACNDCEGALSEANRILGFRPNDQDGLYLKGTVLVRLKAYDQAIVTLNRFIEIDPNHVQARFTRSYAYLESDKLDLAREGYEFIAKTAPNAHLAYYGLGEVAYRSNEGQAAISNYSLFLQKMGTNTSTEIGQAQKRLKEMTEKPRN